MSEVRGPVTESIAQASSRSIPSATITGGRPAHSPDEQRLIRTTHVRMEFAVGAAGSCARKTYRGTWPGPQPERPVWSTSSVLVRATERPRPAEASAPPQPAPPASTSIPRHAHTSGVVPCVLEARMRAPVVTRRATRICVGSNWLKGHSMMEKTDAGMNQADAMFTTGRRHLGATCRTARIDDRTNAVAAGVVDVVPERDKAVRHECHIVETT
jgi:hypothetical protein